MLEAELFAFLENTSDAAFAVRELGEICFWSPAAERLFGFSAEQVKDKTCFAVLDGKGALATSVCHQRCSVMECGHQTMNAPDFDLNVRTGNGRRIWVNISTIDYENKRTGRHLTVHLARDITARKTREELFQRMSTLSQEIASLEKNTLGSAPVSPLSAQEIEILKQFAAGVDAGRVAKTLKISPQTLRNHLHRINQKLRTHSRLEAVTHAMQRGLI